MQELPASSREIKDFLGLRSNVVPRDQDPGAALDQVNACVIKQGELEIRKGYTVVTFEQ